MAENGMCAKVCIQREIVRGRGQVLKCTTNQDLLSRAMRAETVLRNE